ncbi:MAG: HAMP domain-containing histidine kinase, partial [Thermoleophilia bacterium]|nr:HAMP domain-containing histidine kinase [Thermoleophilia bacterium]
MNARSRRVVVLRLTAAFAVSLLAALVAASWWIHEQQETLWKSFDEVEPKTVERIADALYGHLVVGSLVTFVVGVVLAYALASVAIAPVERMRRRELRMLAEAGHELRTPLTTIALEAELALEQQPSAEVAEALRSIVNEARALAHVADEVLELGRGEQAHLEVEPVRLDELAAERVERARRRHELGDDALRVDAPAAVTATANRHAAARAIDNLLDNAARH